MGNCVSLRFSSCYEKCNLLFSKRVQVASAKERKERDVYGNVCTKSCFRLFTKHLVLLMSFFFCDKKNHHINVVLQSTQTILFIQSCLHTHTHQPDQLKLWHKFFIC